MFNLDLEEEPSIDLTPLIDTIFMLLIFFIMTTTFSRPVLDIVLPASSEAHKSDIALGWSPEGANFEDSLNRLTMRTARNFRSYFPRAQAPFNTIRKILPQGGRNAEKSFKLC